MSLTRAMSTSRLLPTSVRPLPLLARPLPQRLPLPALLLALPTPSPPTTSTEPHHPHCKVGDGGIATVPHHNTALDRCWATMLHLDSCCEDRLETTLPETSLVAGQEYWGPERGMLLI
mmetsp:Transcript_49538/g.67457  ORF Transcript_49538/g.67457 Transcript_49538/m.67457 type:complete len:118 (-) Transcript_49538:648-1001(-)